MLLDNPGRVRSQITSVVCQIQRFDFECISGSDAKSNNTDTTGLRCKSSTCIENLNLHPLVKMSIVLLLHRIKVLKYALVC